MSEHGVALDGVVDAVAAVLAKEVKGLRQCKPYAGEFDGERMALHPPALFVACLGGTPSAAGTGQVELEGRFAAYVVADHAGGPQALNRSALGLVERVVLAVHQRQWGLAGVSPAALERVENASSGQIRGRSLALWVVTWRQRLRLGESVWGSDGYQPTEVLAGMGGDAPEDYEQLVYPEGGE